MKILESCEGCNFSSDSTFRQDQRRTIIVIYRSHDHARIIFLHISNMSLLREYPGNQTRRLRTAGKAEKRVCVCMYIHLYIYIYLCALLPRTCPCKRANLSTWWRKTGGDARFSNRRSRRPGHHRRPLLRSPPSLVSAPEMFVALTLCTHR